MQMAAGGVRRAARHTDDGRREVLVEGFDCGGGQPARLRERQGHHRVRLRRQQDVSVQQLRLHGPVSGLLSQRGAHPEARQRQPSQPHIRLHRVRLHRQNRLSRHSGGAQLQLHVSLHIRRQEGRAMSHSVRHR